jgi:small redox-active disulfide protein 1
LNDYISNKLLKKWFRDLEVKNMVVKIEVFTSPSCPYCPMAVQLVDDVKKDMTDDVEIEKIDIMVDQEKAREYGLMAVPAIALNGVVRFVGAPGKEELVEAVKEAIKG